MSFLSLRRGASPWAAVAIVGVIAAAAAGCWFVALPKYREARRVTAPKKYTSFKASDGTFRLQYPDGWSSSSAGAHAIASAAVFKKNSAAIEVLSDLTGSLFGDVMPNPAGMPDLGAMPGMEKMPGLKQMAAELKKPPVERLHETYAKQTAKRFKGYSEGKGKPLQTQLGDARYSEFTAEGGLLEGKLRGYRVTILGTERAFTVLCRCTEEDWAALKKPFATVVRSLQPGGGG